MQLPIITPAPLVKAHAEEFRDLFENRCQFRHFENYLTGLMVLPNKSMANITRCVIESSDKTNLSRYFSKDHWLQDQVNDRRIKYMLQETKHVRVAKEQSALILDDTLCEHVGDLFEYVDHHYNHGDGNYPLAHNPVTSHYVSGPVRFPVDLRLYRRYEEVTRWEEFVHKHFPEREIPKGKKERAKLHKEVDAVLLQDAEYQVLHDSFRQKSRWQRNWWKPRSGANCLLVWYFLTVGIWQKILSLACAAAGKTGSASSKRTVTLKPTVLCSRIWMENAFLSRVHISAWRTWSH